MDMREGKTKRGWGQNIDRYKWKEYKKYLTINKRNTKSNDWGYLSSNHTNLDEEMFEGDSLVCIIVDMRVPEVSENGQLRRHYRVGAEKQFYFPHIQRANSLSPCSRVKTNHCLILRGGKNYSGITKTRFATRRHTYARGTPQQTKTR
jgi:hypothetical protein